MHIRNDVSRFYHPLYFDLAEFGKQRLSCFAMMVVDTNRCISNDLTITRLDDFSNGI